MDIASDMRLMMGSICDTRELLHKRACVLEVCEVRRRLPMRRLGSDDVLRTWMTTVDTTDMMAVVGEVIKFKGLVMFSAPTISCRRRRLSRILHRPLCLPPKKAGDKCGRSLKRAKSPPRCHREKTRVTGKIRP